MFVDDVDVAIGDRVRSLRASSKLTIEDVAASAKMSVSDYSMGGAGQTPISRCGTVLDSKNVDLKASNLGALRRQSLEKG
jgi:hypothetical protein